MAEPAWVYRVTWVVDNIDAVNANMKEWAEAGWELVSGSTATYVADETGDFGSIGGVERKRIIHTQYTMFWRKPSEPTVEPDGD